MDSTDGVKVGEESVPGMRLRCICRGHTGTIGRIAWSPCGRFIASPSTDKTIRIWDPRSGAELGCFAGHTSTVYAVHWSPDSQRIASVGNDSTLRVWDLKTGSLERTIAITEDGAEPLSICWSPRGQQLAASLADGRVLVWDTQRWRVKRTLRRHEGQATCVAWSPTGTELASVSRDTNAYVWHPQSRKVLWRMFRHEKQVNAVVWFSNGRSLATASADGTIRVADFEQLRPRRTLEGHLRSVNSISVGCDDQLLASKSSDNTVKIWRTDSWEQIATISEDNDFGWLPGIAFAPAAPLLTTFGNSCSALRVWDISVHKLLASPKRKKRTRSSKTVTYTSAKVVLVGEANIGKSCLAMRLAENRYPDDHEHGTTHGMRFWPMEAEKLHASAKPPTGQRRDVVLWDFGGQDEYQLVHQMFLHDTTLALVLIDPTRGRAAMDESREWNKRLEKHLGKDRAVKLLVGAKVDRKRDLIDLNSIDVLCKECGFAVFLDLSAKTGRNIKKLRKLISDALDWDQMAKTSRPELFQHIRDEVEARRRDGEVAVLLDEIYKSTKRAFPMSKSNATGEYSNLMMSVDAVSDQLAMQGVIVKTKLMTGDEALVLQLPVIERYAGSLIIAARNNSRGVPVLEERMLGSTKTIPLPGMTKKDRLAPAKERMVLECVVELMIQHGICFRHGALLVFPTLFPTVGQAPPDGDGGFRQAEPHLPFSISLYYDFTGAIDNIYASLVSKLMVSEEFGEGRLRAGRVEFDRAGQGVCGVRQIKRTGGLAHLDLFFSEKTESGRKDLFTRFVEDHLRFHGVDIQEHQAIKCRKCGEETTEEIVQKRIALGHNDVLCALCGTTTNISEGVAKIRERDPKSDESMFALRKKIEEKTAEDVATAKSVVSLGTGGRKPGEPVRLLHLSDLHFTGDTKPKTHLVALLQDLNCGEFLGVESIEYLVISGDMTDKGSDEGFDKAREFVELLIEELGLSFQRCIFVPGNHDVQDRRESYDWQDSVAGVAADEWVKKDDVYLVRNAKEYPNRLRMFSDAFYHKIMAGEPYPFDPAAQGQSYLFPDTRIQFLTLNSACRIDQFHRRRSAISAEAVANAIDAANKRRTAAIERGDLKAKDRILKIGVWHHAVAGPEMMRETEFLSQLQTAGVQLCLHGDVHEMRCDLVGYKTGNELQIVGAGSFGSAPTGRPESTPRLYNLLEIQPDHSAIRVHTRAQPKAAGAWEGWYQWPDPEGGKGKVPFFDIEL